MVVTWNVGFFLATWKPQKNRSWLPIGALNWSAPKLLAALVVIWCSSFTAFLPRPSRPGAICRPTVRPVASASRASSHLVGRHPDTRRGQPPVTTTPSDRAEARYGSIVAGPPPSAQRDHPA